jgi:hypothetical protein
VRWPASPPYTFAQASEVERASERLWFAAVEVAQHLAGGDGGRARGESEMARIGLVGGGCGELRRERWPGRIAVEPVQFDTVETGCATRHRERADHCRAVAQSDGEEWRTAERSGLRAGGGRAEAVGENHQVGAALWAERAGVDLGCGAPQGVCRGHRVRPVFVGRQQPAWAGVGSSDETGGLDVDAPDTSGGEQRGDHGTDPAPGMDDHGRS